MDIKITCKGQKYVPIESLKEFQGNLKTLQDSELEKLKTSILKHGFSFPVFVWNDQILDGHQRVFATRELLKSGYAISDIPVVEIEAADKTEAAEKLLFLNSNYAKITEEGLSEFISKNALDITEFVGGLELPEFDMESFISGLGLDDDDIIGDGGEDPYTKKIIAPNYEPSNEKPGIETLIDTKKRDELISEIERSSLKGPVKNFLKESANRHVVFDYQKIADYYSHSGKETQELMEKSALVIIDFNQAIENGFVKLSEEIATQYSKDHNE